MGHLGVAYSLYTSAEYERRARFKFLEADLYKLYQFKVGMHRNISMNLLSTFMAILKILQSLASGLTDRMRSL